MVYDLIKISGLPLVTPDSGQDIVVGAGDYAKRINYNAVKADMVGTSPSYTTDTEPYLMRQTAHTGVVGKCALNKLVGGSIAWNQVLSQSGLSGGTVGGITLVKNSNGSVTLTGARTGENVNFNVDYVANTIKYQTGHVYYLPWSGVNGIGLQIIMESDVGADSLNKNRLIKVAATASTRSWARIRIGTPMNENIGTVTYFPQILDITQMFGSTIADYAANLENTYGTGIAWLSKYIDLGTYHAYDAGSIQSVQATAHVTTGKNLMPQQTDGIIPCFLPKGAHICASCTTPSGATPNLNYYDANHNRIDYWPLTQTYSGGLYRSFVVAQDAYYIAFTNNTALNKQLEFGSSPTAYEPYTEHVYPLGSDTLRGIPQLVSNKLAYDGDIKTPDGTIRRRYDIVDMGTLPWTYVSASDWQCFSTTGISDKAIGTENFISAIYPKSTIYRTTTDKIIYGNANSKNIYVRDSSYNGDAAAFKSAMSGKYLVYRKDTDSTESSTAYQKIQTIDADGTESFTTSTPVPVGHETQTPDNILAALGWLGE